VGNVGPAHRVKRTATRRRRTLDALRGDVAIRRGEVPLIGLCDHIKTVGAGVVGVVDEKRGEGSGRSSEPRFWL